MPKVTIIDYGIGNILSVKRAFEYCGAKIILTDSPTEIINADYLVLPGVGAFADGMQGLREQNLIGAIQEYSTKGNPFMGICLGMQMMLDESEEFGNHQGLGLIAGKVVAIDNTTTEGEPHKVPHIGWNELVLPVGKTKTWWKHTMLDATVEREATYFVHSFTAVPKDPECRLADTYYGGRLISAAIKKGNIYGCQFHPEKSGEVGLRMIRNFLTIK
jgi:imidazole glycerol-phosphate synthase subunit HisH